MDALEKIKDMLERLEEEEKYLARVGYQLPGVYNAVAYLLTAELGRVSGSAEPAE